MENWTLSVNVQMVDIRVPDILYMAIKTAKSLKMHWEMGILVYRKDQGDKCVEVGKHLM